jgi:hypothetical protein
MGCVALVLEGGMRKKICLKKIRMKNKRESKSK